MAQYIARCANPSANPLLTWEQTCEMSETQSQTRPGPIVALRTIQEAVEASPADGNLRSLLGQVLAAAGRRTEALKALSLALTLGTEIEILDFVAQVAFPGPRYRDHLAWLHRQLRPARYLEIGVFRGETLALARPGTSAFGVDPAPLPDALRAYDADTCIHQLTSDTYFDAVAAGAIDSPAPIGLAFIDGLHLYEQVLRDFINVEKHCDRSSVVVLHDTIPIAPAAAARRRASSYWCGDVWKIVACLRRYRPDLTMLTIPTHPSGLTIVTGLDPESNVLADQFGQAVADFIAAPAKPVALVGGTFGDVTNDSKMLLSWLAASPAGAGLIG